MKMMILNILNKNQSRFAVVWKYISVYLKCLNVQLKVIEFQLCTILCEHTKSGFNKPKYTRVSVIVIQSI